MDLDKLKQAKEEAKNAKNAEQAEEQRIKENFDNIILKKFMTEEAIIKEAVHAIEKQLNFDKPVPRRYNNPNEAYEFCLQLVEKKGYHPDYSIPYMKGDCCWYVAEDNCTIVQKSRYESVHLFVNNIELSSVELFNERRITVSQEEYDMFVKAFKIFKYEFFSKYFYNNKADMDRYICKSFGTVNSILTKFCKDDKIISANLGFYSRYHELEGCLYLIRLYPSKNEDGAKRYVEKVLNSHFNYRFVADALREKWMAELKAQLDATDINKEFETFLCDLFRSGKESNDYKRMTLYFYFETDVSKCEKCYELTVKEPYYTFKHVPIMFGCKSNNIESLLKVFDLSTEVSEELPKEFWEELDIIEDNIFYKTSSCIADSICDENLYNMHGYDLKEKIIQLVTATGIQVCDSDYYDYPDENDGRIYFKLLINNPMYNGD